MRSRLTLPLLVVLTIAGYGYGIRGSVPDVPTGQWMPGASLAQPREGAVSVALDDGRVLIIGGRTAAGPVATVEALNVDGSLTVLSSMAAPRVGHTAVRLDDGNVLVAGGTSIVETDQGVVEAATASVEIFTPGADTWHAVSPLNVARTGHTATTLADGRVLVAGGSAEQASLDSTEVFEPLQGTFRAAGVLSAARSEAAAVVAGESQVLVVGGRNADGVLATADLIDVDSGSVAQLALSSPRVGASATRLLDGTVLVVGGNNGSDDLASAELIDPVAGTSASAGSMSQRRRGHQATLLDHNATVLIVGGTNRGAIVTTAETFVPWLGQFTTTNPPAAARTNAIVASTSTDGVATLAAGKAGDGSLVAATELYGFATVKTDRDDYSPGMFVTITGGGWQPGEVVNMVLHETGPGAEPDLPLTATANGEGRIFNDVVGINESDLGRRFYLTATGAGATAQTTFTDAQSFTLTITPTTVTASTTQTFTLKASNTSSNNEKLACVVIAIPSQFTSPGGAAVTSPATNWSAALGSGANDHTLTVKASSNSNGINPATFVEFTVQTTAPASTVGSPFTWSGTAFGNVNCSSSPYPAPTGAQPTVAVTGASASISGTVYNDANGNGVFDSGEVGISNVTVTRSGSGTTTTTTNGSGVYTFTGLTAGTYSVDYTVPSGFANTGTKPLSVPVAAGATVAGKDFFSAPQYTLTFQQSGLGGDTGSATIVTVNGTPYQASDLPKALTFTAGTSVTYSYETPVASTSAGKRYVLTTPAPTPASPITVSSATTITGTYKSQFQVTFTQSGIGGDSTGTVVTVAGSPKTAADLPFTTDWLDSGANLTYAYSDPVPSTVSGKRYALTTPAPSPASPITVNSPLTVTGTYKTQYQLTFTQSGIGGDSTGTVVTIGVIAKTAAQLPFSDWFDSGSGVAYVYSTPVASTVASKRYALTTPTPSPGSPITVSGAATITGTYKTQFQLTFTQTGIAGDSTGTVVTVAGSPKTAAQLPFDDWFDDGASASYAYADPVASTVSGKQYALTTPVPTPASPITVSGAATITGTYKTQFKVTFTHIGIAGDSTGTIVTVAGNAKRGGDLPFTTDWLDSGTSLNYVYADPVASSVSGKRYALTTPAPSPASPISVTGAATITGTYKTQYQLTFAQSGMSGDSAGTVVTVAGTPKIEGALPFSDWFDSGSSVTYAFTDPVATSVAGKRYTLTTPAPSPASPIAVSGAATITGAYKTQYQLTFAQSGIGGDSTGTVVTIAGSPMAHAALPFSDWFDDGSSVSYTYTDPVATTVTGKRYALTTPSPTPASPITVSSAATITGSYKTQFQVSFTETGIGSDSTGTVVTVAGDSKTAGDLPFTTDWLDSGASLTYAYADPVASSVTGKRYALTTPAPSPASPINVTSPLTVTGTYKIQFLLTFAQSGMSGDSTGTVVTVEGGSKAEAVLPFSDWFDNGSSVTYAYSTPVASSIAGKRYVLTTPAATPASPIAVSGAATITGTYKTQYELTFGQGGIGLDSTGMVVTVDGSGKAASQLPFSDWFDSGASVTYAYADPVATTVSGKRYVLTAPAPTPASPVSVSGALTVTGTYKTQFQVTFAQSGIGGDSTGTIVTVDGDAKEYAQLPFSNWFDDGNSVTYSYADPVAGTVTGKRYALTTPAPSPASPISVTSPLTVTGTYKIQFLLTFAQSGMSGDSTGTVVTVEGGPKAEGALPFSDWFDNGSSVTYAYATPVASSVAGKRYVLTTPAATPASPIAVSGAATITGTYKTQYELTFAQAGIGGDSTGTVVTVAGSPKTHAVLPFSDWFDSGTSVTYAYVDPVATTVTGKRYALTTPAPTPASPITVSSALTVTGTYKTQFQVVFTQSGIGLDSTGTIVTVAGNAKTAGDLPFTTDWLDSGTVVTYGYTDPVASTVAGKRYALALSAPSPASPVTVTSPLTITGTYKIQYLLTFAQAGIGGDSTGTVVTVGGSPKTAAQLPFSDWFDASGSATYSFSDPVATTVTGKRYTLASPAPSPASPVTVSGPATITGTYKIQYLISFGQVGIGGDSTGTVVTVNASGKPASVLPFSDWFDNGGTVTYAYTDPVATSVTGKRYTLTSVPTPSSPISVAGPLSVIGTYKTQYQVTFAQSGISVPDTGSNFVVKVAGADKAKAALPFSAWYDANANVAYSFYSPISTVPVSDKQYELTNGTSLPTSPITVTAATTITGQYAIATYSILYHQPIDQSSSAIVVVNTGKNGRVIPVKVELFKGGTAVQTGTVLMKVSAANCTGGAPTDLVTEYADAGNSNGNTNLFRWNAGSPGFWIYNLDTGALGLQTSACYRLDVYLNATTGSNAVLASSSVFAIFKPVK